MAFLVRRDRWARPVAQGTASDGIIGRHLLCSMAVGEYISVSSQRDSEQADIDKERVEQAKGARPVNLLLCSGRRRVCVSFAASSMPSARVGGR